MSRALAKVFKTGRSQAVRIPKEFRFDCDEVYIERRGEDVVLTPRPQPKSWKEHFKHQPRLSDDFQLPEDFPPPPIKDFQWPE